jgi:hypothetical protein
VVEVLSVVGKWQEKYRPLLSPARCCNQQSFRRNRQCLYMVKTSKMFMVGRVCNSWLAGEIPFAR